MIAEIAPMKSSLIWKHMCTHAHAAHANGDDDGVICASCAAAAVDAHFAHC